MTLPVERLQYTSQPKALLIFTPCHPPLFDACLCSCRCDSEQGFCFLRCALPSIFVFCVDPATIECERSAISMECLANALGVSFARQVPDPDEGMPEGERRYQIYLKSPAGPIDVYVVSQVWMCELF